MSHVKQNSTTRVYVIHTYIHAHFAKKPYVKTLNAVAVTSTIIITRALSQMKITERFSSWATPGFELRPPGPKSSALSTQAKHPYPAITSWYIHSQSQFERVQKRCTSAF